VLRDLTAGPSGESLTQRNASQPLSAPKADATTRGLAKPSVIATPSGTLLNRGQLFGRQSISGRTSSGNSALLSADDNGDKSDKKREDSQREGKQNSPADPRSPAPSGEEKAGRRRQTSQNAPEVHDLVVQAMADEVESLIMSDEDSSEPSDFPPPAGETAEQVAAAEVAAE